MAATDGVKTPAPSEREPRSAQMPGPPQLGARPIRSYVRREGRLTPAQADALERLWPRYGIQPPTGRLALDALFGRSARRVLEIGFGNGENLLARAAAAPQDDFIGIEVHRPGVGYLLRGLEQQGLSNVRVACHDAVELLQNGLAPATLDELLLYFPDPWPKKRHHKRRIVQPAFAALVAVRLKPGGLWRLATDWAAYAEHIAEVMAAAPAFENLAVDGGPVERPAHRPMTRFEKRGERRGHAVADFCFRRRVTD